MLLTFVGPRLGYVIFLVSEASLLDYLETIYDENYFFSLSQNAYCI